MTALTNPFRPDFGTAPPLLAGRDELMREAIVALSAGPTHRNFSTLLLGPRGVGKTAVLNAISDDATAAGWRVLAVDALLSPSDDETVTAQIAERCLEHMDDIDPPKSIRTTGLHLPLIGGGVEWKHNRPRPPTFRRLLDDLIAATQAQGGAGVLITVDEMHNLEAPDASRLSSALQRLTKVESKPLAFVGVGLPSLEHTLLPNKGFTFFQRCRRQRVRNLSLHDATLAIGEPLRDAKADISDPDLRRASAASLGYGYAIQSVGYHIWELSGTPAVPVDSEHVTEAIKLMEEDVGQHVTTPIWSRLSPGDKRFLIAMAEGDEPARLTDVARRIRGNGSGASIYKQRLLDEGVIFETGMGQLMFSNSAVRARALEERDLQAALTEEAERRTLEHAAAGIIESSAQARSVCNHPMPRANAHCALPEGHKGAHRSKRR